MLKLVTIIFLSISSSLAVAAPRFRGTPPKNCERILVSDEKQGEVNDLAYLVADMRGRYKLLTDLMTAPASEIRLVAGDQLPILQTQLIEMESVLAEIRAQYTKSPENVDAGITRLRALLTEYSPGIQAGLQLAPPPPPAPRPHGFPKREVFRALPDLADMAPGSVSDELAGRQMGDQHPNPRQPQTPRPDHQQQQRQQQQQAQPWATDLDTIYTRSGPPRMKP